MKAIKRFVYRNWQRVHGVRRLELAVLTRYLELDGRQRIVDVGSGKGAFCGALARGDMTSWAWTRRRRRRDREEPRQPGWRLRPGGGGGAAVFIRAVRPGRLRVRARAHGRRRPRSRGSPPGLEARRSLRPDRRLPRLAAPLGGVSAASPRGIPLQPALQRREAAGAARARGVRDARDAEYLFAGRLSIAILRFGSLFHYRSVFILLFPILYPLLLLDHALGGKRTSGMILAPGEKVEG